MSSKLTIAIASQTALDGDENASPGDRPHIEAMMGLPWAMPAPLLRRVNLIERQRDHRESEAVLQAF